MKKNGSKGEIAMCACGSVRNKGKWSSGKDAKDKAKSAGAIPFDVCDECLPKTGVHID